MRAIVFSLVAHLLGVVLIISSDKTAAAQELQFQEVQTLLSQFLPKLNEAPDDPAIYDSVFSGDSIFTIKLSEPYWLIPSAGLPEGVSPMKSNNNVSIAIFKNRLFVAFRTGKRHFASKKTGMYIISMEDGKTWKKEMELFPGRDVREPFLIPIGDSLFFYSFAAGTKLTAFEPEYINVYASDRTGKWSEPQKVLTLGEVHWSIKKRNGKVYMSSYAGSHYDLKGESEVSLFLSRQKMAGTGNLWVTAAVYISVVFRKLLTNLIKKAIFGA